MPQLSLAIGVEGVRTETYIHEGENKELKERVRESEENEKRGEIKKKGEQSKERKDI